MMRELNVLMVAATEMELNPLLEWWKKNNITFPFLNLDFLVSGIGMPMTAFRVTQQLMSQRYHLIVQIGLAGAYNRDLKMGNVLSVLTEIHGDIGFEEVDGNVYALEELSPESDRVITNFHLNDWFNFDLPKVISLSVDTTTGLLATVERRTWQYNADIESMEGFALHLVAESMKIPYLQIRAISNYVEQRNKEDWNIPLALKNLNEFLINEFFPSLAKN